MNVYAEYMDPAPDGFTNWRHILANSKRGETGTTVAHADSVTAAPTLPRCPARQTPCSAGHFLIPKRGATDMTTATNYPMTRQGVRDLDNPLPPSRVNVGSSERAACMVAGAFLSGLGVSCGSAVGLLAAAVGVRLIHRGMTGHCAVFQASGVSTVSRVGGGQSNPWPTD